MHLQLRGRLAQSQQRSLRSSLQRSVSHTEHMDFVAGCALCAESSSTKSELDVFVFFTFMDFFFSQHRDGGG